MKNLLRELFSYDRLPAWSLLSGFAIQAFLAALALRVGEKLAWVVWNISLGIRLAGPGPSLGRDAAGRELHEGTPVHILMGMMGVGLGVAVYSLASYFLLRLLIRRRQRGAS